MGIKHSFIYKLCEKLGLHSSARFKIGQILAVWSVGLEARRQKSHKDQEAQAQVNMVLVGIQANVRKFPAVRLAVAIPQLNNLGSSAEERIYCT